MEELDFFIFCGKKALEFLFLIFNILKFILKLNKHFVKIVFICILLYGCLLFEGEDTFPSLYVYFLCITLLSCDYLSIIMFIFIRWVIYIMGVIEKEGGGLLWLIITRILPFNRLRGDIFLVLKLEDDIFKKYFLFFVNIYLLTKEVNFLICLKKGGREILLADVIFRFFNFY